MSDEPQPIEALIEARAAEIGVIDDSLLMETVGVRMALDKLREALNQVETLLDNREFEKASHVGYEDVAHHFVYVQRTLGGLQSAAHQKSAIISSIAAEARVAYENVAPLIEKQMESAVKKSGDFSVKQRC